MKNKINIISLLLVLLFSACNMTIPSFEDRTVTIKSSPTFDVSLGTRTGILDEYRQKIYDNIDEELAAQSGEFTITRVTSTDPTQPLTLELRQDLLDQSIDNFAGETLALDEINQVITPVTFDVPDLDMTETVQEDIQPLAVPGSVSLPGGVSISNIPETIAPLTSITQSISLNATGFSTVTFSEGTLNVGVSLVDNSPGLTVQITSAEIQSAAGTIPATNTPLNPTGTLTFDLTGQSLASSFDIEFTIAVSGGDLSTFDLSMNLGFSGDTRINGASGIDFSESVSGSIPVPMGTNPLLVSATVGTGSITVSMTQAAGWTGITTPISMSLYQGTNPTPLATTTTSTLDLAGITLGAEDLRLDYDVTVTGSNATFAISPTDPEVTVDAVVDIVQFSELIVQSDNLNFEQSIDTPVGTDITSLVSSVQFSTASPRVDLTIDNQLPNDINVTLTSTAMLGAPEVHTFTADAISTNNDWTVYLAGATAGSGGSLDLSTLPDVGSGPYIDFVVDVALTGFNDVTNQLTMNNVTPGQTYSLSGNIQSSLDIASITTNSIPQTGTFPEAGSDPISFADMLDVLPDGLDLHEVAAVLDTDMSGVDSGTITLSLTADYLYVDDSNVIQTVTDEVLIAPTNIVTTTATVNGLSTLINRKAYDLVFEYLVDADGLVVDLGDGSTAMRIQAAMIGTIPFQLEADGDVELLDQNGDSYLPTLDEDIFGRQIGDDTADLKKFVDMVTSAEIRVNLTNQVLTMQNATGDILPDDILELRITEPNNPTFSKIIGLGTVNTVVELTAADIEMMWGTEPFSQPFIPEMHLYVKDTDADGDSTHTPITLMTEGTLDIGIFMHMESDIDLDLTTLGGE